MKKPLTDGNQKRAALAGASAQTQLYDSTAPVKK